MALNQLLPDVLGSYNKGREIGNQNQFNKLAGLALSAPPDQQNALLGQAAQFNPAGAVALQNQVTSNQDRQLKIQQNQNALLNNTARGMIAAAQSGDPARIQGTWAGSRKLLASINPDRAAQLPEQFSPDMMPLLYRAVATTGGDAKVPESVQEFEAMTRGMTPDQVAQAREIHLGLMPKAQGTPSGIAELQYLQQHPDLAQFDMQRRQASRPVTNVNMGQENAFQKALGTKDADAYVGMREQATQAANTLQQADQLEQILGAQKTGKIPEALAMAGQYFGTEAGANLQSLKGVIQPLVLSQVKQLGSGSGISDADRKFVEAGMPGFGNDPRANDRVLRIMRATAQRKIDLYKQADQYVQKNGRLGGFESPLITPEASSTSNDGWAIQRVE